MSLDCLSEALMQSVYFQTASYVHCTHGVNREPALGLNCLGYFNGGFPKNSGYLFGGPYSTDYILWGSELRSPKLGELPSTAHPRYKQAHLATLCSKSS